MRLTELTPNAPRWVSIATGDPRASTDFYCDLFGWRARVDPDPQASGYTTMLVGDEPVAGLSPMFQPGQPVAWTMSVLTASADASPAVWMMSVFVPDVAQASAALQAAGGSVLMAPIEVLDYGRFAVVADPDGAVFELFEPSAFQGTTLFDEPGALAWTELGTRDVEGARAFYGAVFGWKGVQDAADDPGYVRWHADGREFGGMRAALAVARWLVYFSVADVDDRVRRAVELGATVSVRAREVAGVGRFAVLTDPQGAVFAVFAGDLPHG